MSAPERGDQHRPVVLLVDDEAEIRKVLTLGLASEFEVESAQSAN